MIKWRVELYPYTRDRSGPGLRGPEEPEVKLGGCHKNNFQVSTRAPGTGLREVSRGERVESSSLVDYHW